MSTAPERRVARRHRVAAVVALPAIAALAVAGVALAPQLLADEGGAGVSITAKQGAPSADGEPELGRMAPAAAVRERLEQFRGDGSNEDVREVDVLAKLESSSGNLLVVGHARRNGVVCWTQYAEPNPDASNLSCARVADVRELTALRSKGLTIDTISGFAPSGAVSVELSAPGRETVSVPTRNAGSRWRGLGHYMTSWSVDPDTVVTAKDRDGRTMAVITSQGGFGG